MNRDMNKWIDDMLAADKKQAIPVLTFPSVQMMDGITVDDLVRNADLQAQGMQIIAERTPCGAALSYMDLSVEAEAFGSTIRYSDEDVPTVIGSILKEPEDAEALVVPEVGTGRTGNSIEAVRMAAQTITDRPILAGVIGPFSLAGRLLDVTEALFLCYDEPEMVHETLKKVTEFQIKYCQAYKEAGADGVVMAEPLAGILSEDLAEEFSADYVKQIVEAVQDDNFIVVYHNCGNSTIATIDSIVNNGCRVFHFGNAIDMAEMMPLIPENCIAMGNVDPSSQFRNGTPESVYKATTELMEKCCKYPNFVISSGCDIPPLSPWENIDAFFKAIDDFYA